MSPRNEMKFMVVDDEKDIRDMVAIALAGSGHTVTVAPDRGTALEMIKCSSPDILFLDVAMAGLGMEEFLRHLRRISPSTFVVLMTAGYQAANQAQKFGLSSYLQKPFELDALSRCADHWVAASSSRCSASA